MDPDTALDVEMASEIGQTGSCERPDRTHLRYAWPGASPERLVGGVGPPRAEAVGEVDYRIEEDRIIGLVGRPNFPRVVGTDGGRSGYEVIRQALAAMVVEASSI